MMESIPKYIAWQLCAEIWKENQGKWYTLRGLQCWNCSRSSPQGPANRCVNNRPDYRGCSQVNARFAGHFGPASRA